MRETKVTKHQGENSKENKSMLEKELIASEIRYRRLFESAKDGILILNAETGKIADVNPFLLDLLGYTKQHLIDRSIWELGTFHDIFKNREKFLELQQEEYVRYDDLPLVTSDGRKITVEFVSNSYTEGNKKVIQCNIRDTTIERQSELALRKSESHLRALVNTIPDLIWLKDTNGVYLSCNPMFERFFGAKVADIIGKTDYDFVDRELADFFRENDQKALDAVKPVSNEEWVTFADDGHRAYFDTIKSPIYDSDGTLFGILGIGRDITERMLAGQKLHASEKRFRAIFDQAPIAIALVDLQGHPVLSNLRFSKMLGYSKDELSKMMFTEFTHPEDIEKDLNQFSDLIAGKISSYNMEKRYIHKNKNLIWANSFITTLNDDNGLPQEIIGMVEDITERKKIQKEIKFQADLLNNVGQSVIATDLQGKVIYWNKAAEKIYGWSTSEAIGLDIMDLTPAQESNEQAIDIMKTLSAGKPWAGEFQVKRKDGSSFPSFVTDTPIFDSNRKLAGIIGVSSDITERKNTEKALEESELQFRNLYENAKIGLYRTTPDGTILMANKLLMEMLGYESFNELAERNLKEDVFEPSYHREAFLKKIEKDGEVNNLESAWKGRDGSMLYVRENSQAVRNSEGKTIYYDGVVEDITHQKMAEDEIAMLSQSLKSINECVSITDIDHKIIFVNQAFLDTYGYELKELIGKSIGLVCSPKNMQNLISEILPSTISGKWHGELINQRKNGSEFPVYLSTSVIKGKDNKTLGITGVAIDITERKQAETELIEAKEKAEESDRLKTAFLANMSHEIRTPMNGILGFTDLLLEPDLSSEQKEEYINIVKQSGQRMLNTVNDLMEISKIEAGIITVDLKEVNVQERLDELIRFFTPEATKKGLKLTLENEAPKTAATITTDQNKFDSVLTNLIKNAIKYTESGTIKVGCTVETPGNASLLRFYVRDTGIGISHVRQRVVFERFVQAELTNSREFDGSGLGLAITKAYVDMLGGEIGLESRVGQGSTFFFTLPINGQAQEKTAENKTWKQDEKTSHPKGLSIIIAEDDYTSALYLEMILKKGNHTIILTKNGHETVEACRNNPGVDLVLMDIQMPVMNGYDATREIRKFNKEVVIIAQTAFAFSGDKEKTLEAGCNDYISKPITKGVLLEKIQAWTQG